VLTLQFDAAAAGSGSVTFSRNRAFDQNGAEIAGTTLAGGTVTVVR